MNKDKLALWKDRIQEKQASGLSVDEWCAQNQLTKHAYYYWKRRIKELQEGNKGTSLIFAEIIPTDTPDKLSASALRILWKDLEFSISNPAEAALAAEFINQLQKQC